MLDRVEVILHLLLVLRGVCALLYLAHAVFLMVQVVFLRTYYLRQLGSLFSRTRRRQPHFSNWWVSSFICRHQSTLIMQILILRFLPFIHVILLLLNSPSCAKFMLSNRLTSSLVEILASGTLAVHSTYFGHCNRWFGFLTFHLVRHRNRWRQSSSLFYEIDVILCFELINHFLIRYLLSFLSLLSPGFFNSFIQFLVNFLDIFLLQNITRLEIIIAFPMQISKMHLLNLFKGQFSVFWFLLHQLFVLQRKISVTEKIGRFLAGLKLDLLLILLVFSHLLVHFPQLLSLFK